jgi:hypothetical protein
VRKLNWNIPVIVAIAAIGYFRVFAAYPRP